MKRDKTIDAFFALLRAGLWGREITLSEIGKIDFKLLYDLSEQQAVIGLIAGGLEHVVDTIIPKDIALQFAGQALQLERQNAAMNVFIHDLVEKMREEGIESLLIKGQGIAQCYERPLWRVSGDVDLLLSEGNYNRAKDYLQPLSHGSKPERQYSKELALSIGSWIVELHGTQRTGLSNRIDKEIDAVQDDIFNCGNYRTWINDKTKVFLPGVNEDVFLVFTHFIKHFYKEMIGIRQICDWCRLLWTYRDQIDVRLLKQRLHNAGLITEWRAFATVAVDYIGIPKDAIPLYCEETLWRKKGNRIAKHIVKRSVDGRLSSALASCKIFPLNTINNLPGLLFDTTWLKIRERVSKK